MNRITPLLCAALLLGPLACSPATEKDVSELKTQLTALEKKIDALDAKLGGGPQAAAQPQQPPAEDYETVYSFEVGKSPVLGPKDAPVTLVEYSDFQCPYCARADPLIKALQEKYSDKLKVVYKHFPLSFHPAAVPVALASMAAQEQGKFWQFHEIVFENNAELNGPELASSSEKMNKAIERYAKQAGINLDRMRKDLKANRSQYEARIQNDMEEGTKADVRGTPTFYLNGKKLDPSRRSLDGMSAMIDSLLGKPRG